MKLSENRAEAMKNWLVQNASIAGSRMTTQSLGETKPIAPNRSGMDRMIRKGGRRTAGWRLY